MFQNDFTKATSMRCFRWMKYNGLKAKIVLNRWLFTAFFTYIWSIDTFHFFFFKCSRHEWCFIYSHRQPRKISPKSGPNTHIAIAHFQAPVAAKIQKLKLIIYKVWVWCMHSFSQLCITHILFFPHINKEIQFFFNIN